MSELSCWYDVLCAPVGGGYSLDLSPGLLRVARLLRNLDPGSANPRCLTLGPGDGLSAVFHAAALPGEWWLATPKPDQALQARQLADTAGVPLHIVDTLFDGEHATEALPDFDLILAPAIWSAGSDHHRMLVIELARNHLKPGGALLLTYDAMPGCGDLLPLRDVLMLHALMTGSRSESSEEYAKRAIAHLAHLDAAGAALFREVPHRRETLARIAALPPKSLALLFEPSWRPWYFADVERTLRGSARLAYAASTQLLHMHDALCAPPAAQGLLHATDVALKEATRDNLLNTRARADVFVKGLRNLSLEEHITAVSHLSVTLTRELEAFPQVLHLPENTQQYLNETLYRPLLAALAENNYAPKSVETLEDHPLLKNLDSAPLLEMLSVLMGLGVLHPCVNTHAASPEQTQARHTACARLNASLMEKAASDTTAMWLVSPVTGAGVLVPRLEQLFVRSIQRGLAQGETWLPADWGTDAWIALSSHGERLWRDGNELSFADAEAAAVELAETFAVQRLPLLKALGLVVDED